MSGTETASLFGFPLLAAKALFTSTLSTAKRDVTRSETIIPRTLGLPMLGKSTVN